MDSAMSEDLEAVRDTVNRFMQTEVVPVMDGYEKRGEFPRELIRRAGEAGLALWHGETHPCCRCGSQWRMRAALERAASNSHCGEPTDTSLDQSPACRLGRADRP